jgi:hypothetical protein
VPASQAASKEGTAIHFHFRMNDLQFVFRMGFGARNGARATGRVEREDFIGENERGT